MEQYAATARRHGRGVAVDGGVLWALVFAGECCDDIHPWILTNTITNISSGTFLCWRVVMKWETDYIEEKYHVVLGCEHSPQPLVV